MSGLALYNEVRGKLGLLTDAELEEVIREAVRLKAGRAKRSLVDGGFAQIEDSTRAYRQEHRGARVVVIRVNQKTASVRFPDDPRNGFWRYSLDLLTAID